MARRRRKSSEGATSPRSSGEERVEFKASRSWVRRLEATVRHFEMSKAAYIRQAVTERMDADGVAPAAPPV